MENRNTQFSFRPKSIRGNNKRDSWKQSRSIKHKNPRSKTAFQYKPTMLWS